MKIGVIGSGRMGRGLGRIWAARGHEITFSFSRDRAKLDALAGIVPNAKSGTPAEAAAESDVVLLSVAWAQVRDALSAAGSLDGKALIDCTNPLKPDLSGLEVGQTTSAAEEIAKLAQGAKVVKAFNTFFAEVYESETRLFGTRLATMLYCGDDEGAKRTTEELIKEAGFNPVDAGPLTVARYLEPLAMLMIQLGYGMRLGTNIAMSLIWR